MKALNKPILVLLVLIIATLVGQWWYVTAQTDRAVSNAITESTQSTATTVTRVFINQLYPQLADPLGLEGANRDARTGLSGAALERVDREVRAFMHGTDVLKIKLYAPNGMTLYSTELSQVGEDKSGSPAVMSAVQGVTASQITSRDQFHAVEGQVFDRNLVATYLPIRNTAGAVIGVAEVYVDRTPVIEYSSDALDTLGGILFMIQAFLVVLVMLLVWSVWASLSGLIGGQQGRP